MTTSSEQIVLQRATAGDAPLLSNLLELYIHDLSPYFSLEPGPDGRFGYRNLPLYWTEPETRYAFLVRHGTQVVGFALATRGSPASDNPDDLDVAEFFVLRAHRGQGVGYRAAAALWNALPGNWVVRVSNANQSGLLFWRRTVSRYTAGAFAEGEKTNLPHGWRVITFASGARIDQSGS